MNIARYTATSLFLLMAAGCQTTQPSLNSTMGAVKVETVSVTPAPNLAHENTVSQRLFAYANYRLSKQSAPNGTPVTVHVQVTQFHRKDAALSLLVGDANRMSVMMTLSDVSGKPVMQRELSSMNSAAINGVIGAVAAAASKPSDVDDKLADDIAKQIEQSIFGKTIGGRLELPREVPVVSATSTQEIGISTNQ